MTNTLERRFPQEDAASMLFSTSEPTAEEIGLAYTLAKALGADPDAWTLEDLRAGWVLHSLARGDYSARNLGRLTATARDFDYPLEDERRVAVVTVDRHVILASLIDVEEVPSFAMRLHINFSELAPRHRKGEIALLLVAPSADIEFHALAEAA